MIGSKVRVRLLLLYIMQRIHSLGVFSKDQEEKQEFRNQTFELGRLM